MTNASYTFNSFKILDLDDDVVDFFVVKFEKPGRVSAGVSTSIEITFSPEVNTDINTTLIFQTETGPVSIPLICLIKRCAPRITSPHIDLGNMIIGQIQTFPLKMNNTQALGTSFSITPVQPDGSPMPKIEEANSINTTTKPQKQGDDSETKEGRTEEEEDEEVIDTAISAQGDAAQSEIELDARVRRM